MIHRGFVALTRCVETHGPPGNRSPDLVDANESTSAFVGVDRVGREGNPQIGGLGKLKREGA